MPTLRIFAVSLAVTVVALVAGYLYGGPRALFLVVVLSILGFTSSVGVARFVGRERR